MMKKLLIAFILLILTSTGCKKSDRVTAEDVPATITYTGDIAADGCGFLVKINASGTSYHADNLPVDYQKNNLPVIIKYHLLSTKYSCGLEFNNVPVIQIDGIRNK